MRKINKSISGTNYLEQYVYVFEIILFVLMNCWELIVSFD